MPPIDEPAYSTAWDRAAFVLGEWGEQRVALFVDTQNLYYAARDYHAGSVDFQTLLRAAVRGRRLTSATAYVVERDGEATSHGFFTKLSALGYRVRRRSVRIHRQTEDGRTVMEGDWDMGIAADMVRAFDNCDALALASGDGDFTPMVELAQERGKRVEVLAFRESTAQVLIDASDSFINLAEVGGIFHNRATARPES